jgi:hypothetical protein
MQRFDGIDPAFLWKLNAEADRPGTATRHGASVQHCTEADDFISM